MALSELVTQFRILELTLHTKMNKKTLQGENELLFFNTRNTMTVNPFLTLMFFRVSFAGWRNHMHTVVKRHKWNKDVET